jgi:hypothetical protein
MNFVVIQIQYISSVSSKVIFQRISSNYKYCSSQYMVASSWRNEKGEEQ